MAAITAFLTFLPVASATAKESPSAGDSLSQNGINVELVYKYEAGRNLSGGLKVESFSHWNFDARLALNTEKMNFWPRGQFSLTFMANRGQNPGESVGDIQLSSNIDTSPDFSRIYEAWYEHQFAWQSASLLFGLRDLNAEFYVTNTSLSLLNASFGIGYELAQTGPRGPSIFPVTAPAIRLKLDPFNSTTFRLASFSAMSGDVNYPDGTHIRLTKEDGLLVISELQWQNQANLGSAEIFTQYAIGLWTYTQPVDRLDKTTTIPEMTEQVSNSGFYFLTDKSFNDRLSVFLRLGFARPEVNQVQRNVSIGCAVKAPVRHRSNDVFAMGITQIAASNAHRSVSTIDGKNIANDETTLEITYRYQALPGVVIQPDLQYVDAPSFSREVSHATSVFGRIELEF
jgi:porin